MGLYEWGSPPIHSTGSGEASNPASTGVVVAEIDSTQLSLITNGLSGPRSHAVPVRLSATLGGDTLCSWRVEQSVSSTITDASRVSIPINTPTGQSGMYVYTLMVEPGDRIRARTASTITGTLRAFLQVDPLT